ncbi:MAG: hypothetical protein U0T81_09365 [Saprospiraceae bacterium]
MMNSESFLIKATPQGLLCRCLSQWKSACSEKPFSSELNYFYEELDKSSGGTAFMMSSKSKEYSLEDGGLRQGIFSHYLIKGLKGDADADQNKTVTIRELFDYVSKNVREYTGSAQSPVIAGDYDENMPVGFIRQ